jgi:hypothetical protein
LEQKTHYLFWSSWRRETKNAGWKRHEDEVLETLLKLILQRWQILVCSGGDKLASAIIIINRNTCLYPPFANTPNSKKLASQISDLQVDVFQRLRVWRMETLVLLLPIHSWCKTCAAATDVARDSRAYFHRSSRSLSHLRLSPFALGHVSVLKSVDFRHP